MGLADNHQLYKLIVVNKDSGGTSRSPFPIDEPRCAFEALLNSGQGPSIPSIEARYRDLFESTFAGRRFHYFGDGFEMFLGNGYVFPQLGRGEMISSPGLYGG